MSYHFYLFLHLASLFIAFLSLGGICFHVLAGGTKQNFSSRKSVAIMHGTTLLLVFITGFGLIAKAQYSFSTSPWLFGKMFCWLVIGMFPAIAYRRVLPRWGNIALVCVVAVAAVALVVFKPS